MAQSSPVLQLSFSVKYHRYFTPSGVRGMESSSYEVLLNFQSSPKTPRYDGAVIRRRSLLDSIGRGELRSSFIDFHIEPTYHSSSLAHLLLGTTSTSASAAQLYHLTRKAPIRPGLVLWHRSAKEVL